MKPGLLKQVFVSFVVFVCGAVLMALEIAGSRVLAPYFGNTIFIWASLISVLLVALALGYYIGGRAADDRLGRASWAGFIAAAGFLIFLITFIGGPVSRYVVLMPWGDRWGSLVASTALLFLPSFFLGMVSPFAIKFCVEDVKNIGTVAGRLYAVSTAGSVVGTLLTAFYLIEKIGTSAILALLGAVLIFLSILIFALGRRPKDIVSAALLTLALVALTLIPLPALVKPAQAQTILLQKDSFYNNIMVSDFPGSGVRQLSFGPFPQTLIYLGGHHESAHNYSDMLHLPAALVPDFKNVLIIGGGGGVVARHYSYDYPQASIDQVEIDPMVVAISKEYFFFKERPNLKAWVGDGRRFVQQSHKTYDIVVVDAYAAGGQIPFHLVTAEFFREIKNRLSARGVVALNLVSAVRGPHNRLFLSVMKTLRAVFPNIVAFPNTMQDPSGKFELPVNIIIVASGVNFGGIDGMRGMAQKAIDSKEVKVDNLGVYFSESLEYKESLFGGGCFLIDDHAPVEFLS